MSTATPPDPNDPLLKELRERYDYATEAWREIRENGAKNMRYVAGDPWDKKEREAREAAGRPCLSLDEINQHTNQVINDVRSNRRGVKFDGKDENVARWYQDKAREIEYRSHAQIVYTTAFQNAVERSYGWARWVAKYVDDRTRNQELWLEEIPNPDSVLPDPDAKRPDSSDMRYCFVHETRKVTEFKREFPNAQITDFSLDLRQIAPNWLKGEDLVLAEYWTVKVVERTLVFPPQAAEGVYLDELKDSSIAKGWDRVTREKKTVCKYLTNGVEILEKTEWPGKYIPLASCFGKVIYVDNDTGVKRQIQSMVDLMRDPQMIYAYLRTNEAELVGMTPKTPFVGYVGQFRTRADIWAKLNHVPSPYVEADAVTEATGPNILPLPQRQPYDPPIQSLEILAESAIRSIRSAAGSTPLPSAAARRSEKSGVALKRIEDMAALGSYHFRDHYNDFIRQLWVIGEDLMDKFYDTAREVMTRTPKGEAEATRINDPADPKSINTKQDHQVEITTGPSFESEQEAGSDMADTLVGMRDPEVVRAVLPLVIKLKNLGVVGDELVEIAEALQPPQIQALRQKDGEAPDPAQIAAENEQLKQRVQHAEQAMGELEQEARGKKLEIESKEKIAQAEIVSKEKIADIESRRRAATAIAVAHINASTKGAALDQHAEEEAMALAAAEDEQGREHAHEAFQAELDRQHEQGMAQAQADHDAAMGAASSDADAEEADAQRTHEAQLTQSQLEAQAAQAEKAGE